MTAHTEGPWEIFQSPNCTHPGIEADNFSIVVYGNGSDKAGVKGKDPETMIANASLIASAPELLALARATESLMGVCAGDEFEDCEFRQLLEQATAAIAKATGEKS